MPQHRWDQANEMVSQEAKFATMNVYMDAFACAYRRVHMYAHSHTLLHPCISTLKNNN
jgi:hypothetical protein